MSFLPQQGTRWMICWFPWHFPGHFLWNDQRVNPIVVEWLMFFSQVSSMENLWFSAKNIPCRSPTKSGAPQVRGIPTLTLAPCAGSGARLVESHRNADGTDGKKVGKYERIWMNMDICLKTCSTLLFQCEMMWDDVNFQATTVSTCAVWPW